MRKTTKRLSQLTLSAEKVRELQSAREIPADNLGIVVGGKQYCAGSSMTCIDSAMTC